MKKVLCALFAAVLACGLLAGCGASGNGGSGSGSDSGATASKAALEDGTYDIEVETDSSMVNVVYAKLKVADGKMTCTMALHGQGFSRLFEGTADEAAKADASQIVDYVAASDGLYTFTFPVEALDTETQVALYGQRRDTWYEHKLTFKSEGAKPADEASASTPADGSYQVAVTLSGGSGRASVDSPATLVVNGGKMTATIVWSSSSYDKMVVDGTEYKPTNTSGNSTFDIPVSALDTDLAVSAETTAMSQPHMIDYTLNFDSKSLAAK